MGNFFEANATALKEFAGLSQEAGARADYVQGGGGNASVKLNDGLMAIKASGFKLSDITENNAYAVLDYKALLKFYMASDPELLNDVEAEGSAVAKKAAKRVEGLKELRPSVEAGFHSLLDKFVLHTHSVYANLASCAEQGREIVREAMEGAPYSCAFVEYVNPGAMLTFCIRDEIKRVVRETGKRPSIIIMQNHGIIATSSDAFVCLKIHADANGRIARKFRLWGDSFPAIRLKAVEGGFKSDTGYLRESLKGSGLDSGFFIDRPLYPDQLVFLSGTLAFGRADENKDAKCVADTDSGEVVYRMDESGARTVEETLTAIMFIVNNIKRAGYSVKTMDEAGKAFIAGWESEKYRKSLMNK